MNPAYPDCSDEVLASRLEAARRELLDLSLRNPLLNFRPSKAQGVTVVREEAAAVYEVLVRQGKTMYFQALPEPRRSASKAGTGQPELLSQERPVSSDQPTATESASPPQAQLTTEERQLALSDNKLQTDETTLRLEARLLHTTYAARTSLEETGVNILYLALGMLTWYETETSEEARQAPLVLVPVLLERGTATERFKLRYTGAEVEANLSLQVKLQADFNLALPLPELDEEGRLEPYYATVAALIKSRARWQVTIDAIALGFFSFAKLAMYVDLDASKWPTGAGLLDHPAIKALLSSEAGFHDRAPTVDHDTFLDTDSTANELHQVLDADSSQLLALLAVQEGRNIVIQGPPGTGKSQTITNLLAEAIGAGKKVLFVAEKMAALEVVKRRLDALGLGAACLELHSHKANKKTLLEELRNTLNLGRPAAPAVLTEQMAQLPRYRAELNNYARVVNQPVGRSRFTAQQVAGLLLEIQHQTPPEVALPRIPFARLETWTDDDAAQAEALADRLAATLRRVGTPRELLFWGSDLQLLLPADQLALAALLPPAQVSVRELQAAAAALATLLGEPTPPANRTTVEALLPYARQIHREAVVAYAPTVPASIERLQAAGAALASLQALPAPTDRAAAHTLLAVTHHTQQAPPLAGIAVADPVWSTALTSVREVLAAGQAWLALHARFDAVLLAEAWQQTLSAERGALLTYGGKWWSILSGEYRRTRLRMQGLWRGKLPDDPTQLTAAIDAIHEAARHEQTIRDAAPVAGPLFGPHWQGVRSDWPALARVIDYLALTHQRIGRQLVPAELLRGLAAIPSADELSGRLRTAELALQEHQAAVLTVNEVVPPHTQRVRHLNAQLPDLPFAAQLVTLDSWRATLPHPDALATRLAGVEAALPTHRAATQAVADALQLDEVRRFGPEGRLQFQPFEVQLSTLAAWAADLPAAQQVLEWNNVAAAARQHVPELVDLAERWPLAGEWLKAAVRQTWLEYLQRRAHTQHPELRQFERAGHEEVAARFRQADRDSLLHNRVRAMRYHFEQLPNQQASGQMLTLRNEFARKRGHMPIRKLVQQAGRAIQAIKPVFMMSPLSVANFLPPGAVGFDLVVFDEASQVKPVDALGAIARGKQLVVVGDSKQLPPTSFFDSLTGATATDDDGDNVTADIRSILELMESKLSEPLSIMLRWHYRSLHQSLIAASNHLFYEDKLVIFPSPGGKGQLGLAYHHLPDTHYERGTTRTNPLEAAAVADAVMRHAQTTPRLTLGVVAFSMAQRQAIQDALEVRRKQHPETEAFFNRHPHEPFFVKNLENVQGDERDVILISVGYGRTIDGYLSMSFGPLNGEGGERRLNVLITRAKQRCEVFTNLSADDLDLSRTNARGVAALKTFLHFAQFGRLNYNEESDREMESPFEEAVYRALSARGYVVRPQIGSQGFYIDLAVVDPDQPGRYVLGIECDGAMYHSAKSARDRDRLRQQVLEAVGWRLHRIWSTDWFRDPAREIERAVAAIEEARQLAAADEPEEEPETVSITEPTAFEREEAAPEAVFSSTPYVTAQVPPAIRVGEFHDHPAGKLAQWATEVVRVESPVHIEEVARRLAYAAGLKSLGSRIRASVEAGVEIATRMGALRHQGDFLWLASMHEPEVRDRSTAPDSARKLALIAPEEIGAAIQTVVRHSFTIDREAVAAPTLRLLGFSRVTEDARLQVEAVVAALVQRNQLRVANGLLQL